MGCGVMCVWNGTGWQYVYCWERLDGVPQGVVVVCLLQFFFRVVVIPMLVDRDFVFVCPYPCRRNVATIPEPRARDSVVVIVGPFRPMSGDFKCVVACWVAVSRRA